MNVAAARMAILIFIDQKRGSETAFEKATNTKRSIANELIKPRAVTGSGLGSGEITGPSPRNQRKNTPRGVIRFEPDVPTCGSKET